MSQSFKQINLGEIFSSLRESPIFTTLQLVFLILDFILFLGIIILIFKTSWFKEKYGIEITEYLPFKRKAKKREEREWTELLEKAKSKIGEERKLAVLEAEDLLEEILTQRGIEGKNLKEKIENLQKTGKIKEEELEEFLKAQEIISQIIHNPDQNIGPKQAQKVLTTFQKLVLKIK